MSRVTKHASLELCRAVLVLAKVLQVGGKHEVKPGLLVFKQDVTCSCTANIKLTLWQKDINQRAIPPTGQLSLTMPLSTVMNFTE